MCAMNTRRHEGFTLVELMITLLGAAAVLGVGIPNFQDFLANNRMATSANDVITALHAARSEAVKRRANMTICPGANWDAGKPTCNPAGRLSEGHIGAAPNSTSTADEFFAVRDFALFDVIDADDCSDRVYHDDLVNVSNDLEPTLLPTAHGWRLSMAQSGIAPDAVFFFPDDQDGDPVLCIGAECLDTGFDENAERTYWFQDETQ